MISAPSRSSSETRVGVREAEVERLELLDRTGLAGERGVKTGARQVPLVVVGRHDRSSLLERHAVPRRPVADADRALLQRQLLRYQHARLSAEDGEDLPPLR